MKVAVVAKSMDQARAVIARLGMVGKATPLILGVSPLAGLYFTAIIRIPVVMNDEEMLAHLDDTAVQTWWTMLLARTKGPVFRLEEE